MLDFIEDFHATASRRTSTSTNAAHRQPHLEAAHRRHRCEPERALNLGFTGPMLRGSGIAWDLRKKQPYDVYDRWTSTSRSAATATATTAILVRVEEMRQSNRIIKQCIAWLRANPGR